MIVRYPKIRKAMLQDTSCIEEMLRAAHLWVDGLDWSELDGWFVAEHKNKVVGAMQILKGKPLSCFAYNVVSSEYNGSGVGAALAAFAQSLLSLYGADGMFMVTQNEQLKKHAERLNVACTGEFTMYIKRIPKWRSDNVLLESSY